MVYAAEWSESEDESLPPVRKKSRTKRAKKIKRKKNTILSSDNKSDSNKWQTGSSTSGKVDKIKFYFKSYLKSTYKKIVQNSRTNIENIIKLNFEPTNRFFVFHCANVSFWHHGTVNFDSDTIEAILYTGCSTSISFEWNDVIDHKPMKGKVECLGIHNIVGTCTIKYTVLDDNGDKVNLLIKNAIHVPTIDVRLISLQQIAQ